MLSAKKLPRKTSVRENKATITPVQKPVNGIMLVSMAFSNFRAWNPWPPDHGSEDVTYQPDFRLKIVAQFG